MADKNLCDRLNDQYGIPVSGSELLHRYLDLSRQRGKTETLIKMIKDGSIVVVHAGSMQREIQSQIDPSLKVKFIIFTGSSIEDLKYRLSGYNMTNVLIDNCVMDVLYLKQINRLFS